jgi:hypothetical protein
LRKHSNVVRAVLAASAACAVTILLVPVGTQVASAAPGSVVFSDAPGTSAPPSTLGPYSMTRFAPDTQAVGASVASVAGPTGTVGFSPSLEHCLTPNPDGCWQTWSNGYSGDVYATSTESITITLPPSAKAFYFYAEPDEFMTFSMSATSDDGTTSGAIPVAGFSGAEYFGFYATGAAALKTITVSGEDPDGFAIGEFGISSCSYNTPASWTTSPVASLTPGVEPLNVVISGCSNVSLEDIREGLGDWGEVAPSCLSQEQANVTGTPAYQQESWRLESQSLPLSLLSPCWDGNVLSLSGTENHLRIWNQPIAGTHGAWFISASYETLCVYNGKEMVPGRNYSLAELGIDYEYGLTWHCIDGSQGSIGSDGYDRGAQNFVGSIQAAAAAQNWDVSVQTINTGAGIGEGHAGTGVSFDGTVYVVIVDHATS